MTLTLTLRIIKVFQKPGNCTLPRVIMVFEFTQTEMNKKLKGKLTKFRILKIVVNDTVTLNLS